MRVKIFLGVLLVCAVGGMLAAQSLEPLHIKTGLWEVTIKMNGTLPIPPEMLAKMSPEQRAKIEERFKAQMGENTYKECLTKEKLEKNAMFEKDREGCTRTVGTATGSKVDVHLTCDKKGNNIDIALLIEALNSETVKGTTHITSNGGTSAFNMTSTFNGKWVGASCGDVK
jgi:hypothetical protein